MPNRLPIILRCPNCNFNIPMTSRARAAKGWSFFNPVSVTVAKCCHCGQIMCASCCNHSFWFGYVCPKCGSKKKENIGRIKSPYDPPTLIEDLEDGRYFN